MRLAGSEGKRRGKRDTRALKMQTGGTNLVDQVLVQGCGVGVEIFEELGGLRKKNTDKCVRGGQSMGEGRKGQTSLRVEPW